jgi:cysteine-rich repeat protein
VSDTTTQQCFRCVSDVEHSSSIAPVIALETSSVSCTTDDDCSGSRKCIDGQCLLTPELTDIPPFCGNGSLDAGEQCDDADKNSNAPNAHCRPNCTLGRCGDAIIDTPLELCDDGNDRSGDGCSSTCQPERQAPQTLPGQVIELPFTPQLGNQPGTSDESTTVGGSNALPPSNPSTGPETLLFMISGAAAGYAFMRRRRS